MQKVKRICKWVSWMDADIMAMFVHLAPKKKVKAILRNGISRLQRKTGVPSGIFAMPVTHTFYVSHQWLRELKRRGQGPVAGIYFRIPDEVTVWLGHYNQAHQPLAAARAAGLIAKQENHEGFQVIIPRRISKSEIHRVRVLPQIVGWRYFPGAHGKKPCPCPVCQSGNYGAGRIRQKYG